MANNNDDRVRQSLRFRAMMDAMTSLHDTEELQLEHARAADGQFFSLIHLVLEKGVDRFVSAARNNHSVKRVCLDIGRQRIFNENGHPVDDEEYYKRWEKLSQGLGSLEGLVELKVNSRELLEDPENPPDYRALGTVLRHIPQLQNLSFCCSLLSVDGIDEVAAALTDHPNLEKIQFEQRTDADALGTIARQLTTLPKLEFVEFGFLTIQRRILPTPFFSVVGMPSLRVLKMHKCQLAESQGQLIAQELAKKNSRLELLDLLHSRIEGEGCAQLLQGLLEHQSIKTLRLSMSALTGQTGQSLATLVSKSRTMKELTLAGRSFIDHDNVNEEVHVRCEWLSPLLDTLKGDVSTNVLDIGEFDEWSPPLTDKLRVALASKQCSLECLSINAHNLAPAWAQLMPVLALNSSLKQLNIGGGIDRHDAVAIASHLSQNQSLERLAMIVVHDPERGEAMERLDDEVHDQHQEFTMARCVKALGHSSNVKALEARFPHRWEMQDVTWEGTKELEAAFANNYSLEEVRGRYDRDSMVPELCRLNRAGRRYLTKDQLNRARGVQVLAAVSDSLDALYFHLSENPSLCEGCLERIGTLTEDSTVNAIRTRGIKRTPAEGATPQFEAKRRSMTGKIGMRIRP